MITFEKFFFFYNGLEIKHHSQSTHLSRQWSLCQSGCIFFSFEMKCFTCRCVFHSTLPWPACARARRDRRRPWHGFWDSGCYWRLPGYPKSSSIGRRPNQRANQSGSHPQWCWHHQPDTHCCLHGQWGEERREESLGWFALENKLLLFV